MSLSYKSLPTRERGLKYGLIRHVQRGSWSLPTRERGLKSGDRRLQPMLHLVAPYTGAWIEIVSVKQANEIAKVAPYTGAWIEIIKVGLVMEDATESLPTRERGLKSTCRKSIKPIRKSLPTRERGLKLLYRMQGVSLNRVAPYTGAWIEIKVDAMSS